MKLNTKSTKKAAGMTLLELTVVILVLLSLISILFIGARAWKKGSDRAGCIMNIRNVQQAVRSYQNMNNKRVGDTLAVATITGSENFLEVPPECPGDGAAYTYSDAIPATGTLYAACGNADAVVAATHVPDSFSDW